MGRGAAIQEVHAVQAIGPDNQRKCSQCWGIARARGRLQLGSALEKLANVTAVNDIVAALCAKTIADVMHMRAEAP